MRVAIYARRSTEEHQAESIDTQLENARRFVVARGWLNSEERVFVDSGISRAEFKNRPALNALLAAAKRHEIDILVFRDESRLGGDTLYSGLAIQTLVENGCRVFLYATGEELKFSDANSKLILTVRNYQAEVEREKISSRTRENLERKARAGMNAGGRCYGYDNVAPVENTRGFVDYRINEAEAKIVVEIFESYAQGRGLKAIVKQLNGRGVPSPRAGGRGTGSWAPSAVHAMLRNGRYRGVLVWGRRAKTYRGGTKVRIARPMSECVRVERPDLRIVSEDLWSSVGARIAAKTRMGRARPSGARARYLLSGFSKCGVCGGRMQVGNGRSGHKPIKVYACASHRDRGTCENSLRRPVEAVDHVVLDWLTQNVLTEEVVAACLREVRRRIGERSSKTASELPALEKRSSHLRREIDRHGARIRLEAGALLRPELDPAGAGAPPSAAWRPQRDSKR